MTTVSLHRAAEIFPVIRGFAHKSPQYFTGSVIENRLGLQVFKMLGKQMAWHMRSSQVTPENKPYVDTLLRDGVLMLPNFLPPEQFAAVKEEVERIRPQLQFKPIRGTPGRLQDAAVYFDAQDSRFPAIRKYLQQNPVVLGVGSAVMRRPIGAGPKGGITVIQKVDDSAPDNDTENNLHSDLHTPTVKMFFYLEDTDETNGAFAYAKGSHAVTLDRLKHEYDISIRTAKLKMGSSNIPSYLLAERGGQKRNIIADELKERMKLTETHMCGPANTMIMSNPMGFHRRGDFTSFRRRELIVLNFRHLEPCFW